MSILTEYLENANISCIHYVVNGKLHWSERIFWLIAIIMSTGGAYYVINSFMFQFNNEATAIRFNTDYLQFQTPYPSVILCEKNGKTQQLDINKNKVFGRNTSYDNEQLQHALDMAFMSPKRFGNTEHFCRNDPQKCLQGNFSYYMQQLRSTCDKLFTFCEYNYQNFSCCEQFLPVRTAYGTCYAFNNFAAIGKKGTHHKHYYVERHNGTLTIEAKNQYIIISIMSPNAVPTTKNTETILADSISTDFEKKSSHKFFIRVELNTMENEYRSLPVERKNCRFDTDNNLKNFDHYSQSNCELNCLITAQLKFCDCIAHILPQQGTEKECNLTGLWCTFDNPEINNYMSDKCICSPDCQYLDVFQVGYLALDQTKVRFRNSTSVIRFQVLVQPPTLAHYKYVVTSQLDLIVKIGGAVSFFLGCSVLSIVQLIYYFFIKFLNDKLRWKIREKIDRKNKKMDENFYVGNMKLKLRSYEKRISDDLRRKRAGIVSHEI